MLANWGCVSSAGVQQLPHLGNTASAPCNTNQFPNVDRNYLVPLRSFESWTGENVQSESSFSTPGKAISADSFFDHSIQFSGYHEVYDYASGIASSYTTFNSESCTSFHSLPISPLVTAEILSSSSSSVPCTVPSSAKDNNKFTFMDNIDSNSPKQVFYPSSQFPIDYCLPHQVVLDDTMPPVDWSPEKQASGLHDRNPSAVPMEDFYDDQCCQPLSPSSGTPPKRRRLSLCEILSNNQPPKYHEQQGLCGDATQNLPGSSLHNLSEYSQSPTFDIPNCNSTETASSSTYIDQDGEDCLSVRPCAYRKDFLVGNQSVMNNQNSVIGVVWGMTLDIMPDAPSDTFSFNSPMEYYPMDMANTPPPLGQNYPPCYLTEGYGNGPRYASNKTMDNTPQVKRKVATNRGSPSNGTTESHIIPGVYFDRRKKGFRVRFQNVYVGWVSLSRYSSYEDAYIVAKSIWDAAVREATAHQNKKAAVNAGIPLQIQSRLKTKNPGGRPRTVSRLSPIIDAKISAAVKSAKRDSDMLGRNKHFCSSLHLLLIFTRMQHSLVLDGCGRPHNVLYQQVLQRPHMPSIRGSTSNSAASKIHHSGLVLHHATYGPDLRHPTLNENSNKSTRIRLQTSCRPLPNSISHFRPPSSKGMNVNTKLVHGRQEDVDMNLAAPPPEKIGSAGRLSGGVLMSKVFSTTTAVGLPETDLQAYNSTLPQCVPATTPPALQIKNFQMSTTLEQTSTVSSFKPKETSNKQPHDGPNFKPRSTPNDQPQNVEALTSPSIKPTQTANNQPHDVAEPSPCMSIRPSIASIPCTRKPPFLGSPSLSAKARLSSDSGNLVSHANSHVEDCLISFNLETCIQNEKRPLSFEPQPPCRKGSLSLSEQPTTTRGFFDGRGVELEAGSAEGFECIENEVYGMQDIIERQQINHQTVSGIDHEDDDDDEIKLGPAIPPNPTPFSVDKSTLMDKKCPNDLRSIDRAFHSDDTTTTSVHGSKCAESKPSSCSTTQKRKQEPENQPGLQSLGLFACYFSKPSSPENKAAIKQYSNDVETPSERLTLQLETTEAESVTLASDSDAPRIVETPIAAALQHMSTQSVKEQDDTESLDIVEELPKDDIIDVVSSGTTSAQDLPDFENSTDNTFGTRQPVTTTSPNCFFQPIPDESLQLKKTCNNVPQCSQPSITALPSLHPTSAATVVKCGPSCTARELATPVREFVVMPPVRLPLRHSSTPSAQRNDLQEQNSNKLASKCQQPSSYLNGSHTERRLETTKSRMIPTVYSNVTPLFGRHCHIASAAWHNGAMTARDSTRSPFMGRLVPSYPSYLKTRNNHVTPTVKDPVVFLQELFNCSSSAMAKKNLMQERISRRWLRMGVPPAIHPYPPEPFAIPDLLYDVNPSTLLREELLSFGSIISTVVSTPSRTSKQHKTSAATPAATSSTAKSDQAVRRELALYPINSGTFCTVFEGTYAGQPVAIKCPQRFHMEQDPNMMQLRAIKEWRILSRAKSHPNILKFIGAVIKSSREIWLVTEFVKGGDLYSKLYSPESYSSALHRTIDGGLTPEMRHKIMLQLSRALSFLHCLEPKIIHKDLKTNNILIAMDGNVQLCDFGDAEEIPTGGHIQRYTAVTWQYAPPEIVMSRDPSQPNGNPDEKVDLWSLGCVLLELSYRPTPFWHVLEHLDPSRHHSALQEHICEIMQKQVQDSSTFSVYPKLPRTLECIVSKCLQVDPSSRPSAIQVTKYLLDNEKELIKELTILERHEKNGHQ